MGIFKKTKIVTEVNESVEKFDKNKEPKMSDIAPKDLGKLDMVIAFDTTGSMANYIDAVRKEVSDLIPQLFKDNEDLRLSIVAFGDYCDMTNPHQYGDAYQFIELTNNENDLIKFVKESKNTSGGDGDEFYELVLKRIIDETPWREGSRRTILLIADAEPHPLGYSYGDCVKNNQIDWRLEARKAADKKIKIDTVKINDLSWFREVSAMTNGVSVPFRTGYKTAELVKASINARGSMKARMKFDAEMSKCLDQEMRDVYASYKSERDDFDI